MVSFHKQSIYLSIVLLTLLLGVIGWSFPEWMEETQYFFLGILVLLIGLPHGATDYLLFRRLHGPKLTRRQIFKFFFFYLSAVLVYLLAWIWLPVPALFIFLIISAYHFGQSNWEYLRLPRGLEVTLNLSWGAFALGGALFWHWEESRMIITQLVGSLPDWSNADLNIAQWVLLALNVFLIVGLRLSRHINNRQLFREFISLGALSFMFLHTPLLVGFAIYFSLWHSLSALLTQVAFFRKKWPAFTLVHYYRQAAPFTLLSVAGLLALVFGQALFFADVSLVSLFFILIACITLPHILLVEELYK